MRRQIGRMGDGKGSMAIAVSARTTAGPRTVEPAAAVLVAAVAVAMALQGAFYPRAQLIVTVLVAGALLLVDGSARSAPDLRVAAWSGVALAAWALAVAVFGGAPARGLPYVAVLGGGVLVARACSGLAAASVRLVTTALLVIGGCVAFAGWAGVVLHMTRWAFVSEGVWRASSTLSYPNATAAVLAMLSLTGLGLLTGRRSPNGVALVTTMLLAGLGATLSRAGWLAFAVGLVVLAGVAGPRRVFRVAAPPLVGAAVAVATLAPSTIGSGPARALVAAAGLVVGAALGVGLPRLGRRTRVITLLAAAAVVVGGVARTPGALDAVRRIVASRATVSSPDRGASSLAAWRAFEAHPWLGSGPGNSRWTLVRADGGLDTFRFVHDEYLQVLAELGVVGLVLLLVLVVATVRGLARMRVASGPLGADVLAASVAISVHAGFDFVWHVPAVPLLLAVLVGLSVAAASGDRPGSPEGKEHS